MFVYEIIAEVREELVATFEMFMVRRHIPDVLSTGRFEIAVMSRAGNRFRIEYTANELSAIEYLGSDAEPLRKDFRDHFPRGVELSREIWERRASFKKPERE